LKGLIARVTIIIPLILGILVTIVLDVLDDLRGILTAVKDGKITVQEQREIDYRRSKKRWATITACSHIAPFFTVEQ
jgi:hypothetical protein